jgi:DNA-binding PadR family transcriptional regulator
MSLLSRTEETILLAVWRLKENAYGVTIADMLSKTSGKQWVLGAVYVPLERLEKKGYMSSYLGDSTNQRGGRSKRLYRLTKVGLKALISTKNMEKSLWQDISVVNLEEEYER